MTNREREMNLLHYKSVDRLPAVHFGYWQELLVEWAEQGHIPMDLAKSWHDGNQADDEINKIVGWDSEWSALCCVNMELSPKFERKVLGQLPNGMLRVQNDVGLIEQVKPGVTSIGAEDDYLLKNRQAFEELYLPKMQFSPSRIPSWVASFFEKNDYDCLHGIKVGSILGDIRNMLSVVGLSEIMYDEDDETLLGDIVDAYAEMQYKCVEEVLKTGIKADLGHYWEDVCFKNGPLISPTMFEDLCAKHYRKRNDLCHKYGIDIITLDCDGVTELLLKTWFDNGVNVMFPIEVGVWGDQFENARKKYGKGKGCRLDKR